MGNGKKKKKKKVKGKSQRKRVQKKQRTESKEENEVQMKEFEKLSIERINLSECVLCGVKNPSMNHFSGKKHQNKMKLITKRPKKFPFKCVICKNKTFEGVNAWNQH